MRAFIDVPTSHTVRPEGILLPVEVLNQVFAQDIETVCANLVEPVDTATEKAPGLMIVTNSKGADEIIGFLKTVGTKRSLEVAALLDAARIKNRGREIQ